ncbi:hypothetical protein pdam_00016113 [Pocillopora damicornis]|uniref:Uncharacterized protein n=1 Tax=Pocillopora damicornis TaxID=46731 RepID=A0A3M6UB86_POCDA|nr:hypothetical protein pdam_00016113 [Pocillopora damicornis]
MAYLTKDVKAVVGTEAPHKYDTAMNSTEESGSVPSVVEADVVSQNPSSNSQLVDEVFSLVKGYLTSQLEEKGKRFERSS